MKKMEFRTSEEVCDLLQISRSTLDRLVAARQIAYIMVGGRRRFLDEDVTAYLRRRRVPEDVAATRPDSGRTCPATRPKSSSATRRKCDYVPGMKVV